MKTLAVRNFISFAYSCRFMSINFVSSQFVQWVVFFQFKYICNRKIIPVRIAHKSDALRQALSHTSTERKCTRDKCLISNTGLCLRRNAVYQLTCNSCDQQYIGSTTRFIYDRIGEHINNENSSVKKRIYSCQTKDYRGIDVKIIMSENLRLYDAF